MNIAVVGANRGIGLEFVNQLTKEHSVYAFCRAASQPLKDLNPEKIIEGCDTSKQDSIERALGQVEGAVFDWLFVVAGILNSENLQSWNEESIVNQFMINAYGAVNTARLFVPLMASGSKVGLLTSRMGSVADNTSGGMYGYRMSKAALNAGGKSLANDLTDSDITVHLLHPGYVRTDMTNNNGNIDVDESVRGLIKIMSDKGLEETGSFWHTNGEQLPW